MAVIHLPSRWKISHTIIESLPTSTTLVENSDSNREEIDIFSGPDDSIPPGIESDFDSEEDILDNLLNDDSTHEPARLGCAETKVATWDDLAFKLIILGWNVKHSTDIAKISRKRSKPDNHGHGNGIECAKAGRMLLKIREPMIEKNEGEGLIGASNRLGGLEASPRQYKYKQGHTHKISRNRI
ncbi:hypothetical protein Tco_1514535 [Tanacetum coccineum]